MNFEEIVTGLFIAAMIIVAALYTNPPGIRCQLLNNQSVCVSIND